MKGHTAIVGLLLEAGANYHVMDKVEICASLCPYTGFHHLQNISEGNVGIYE